MYTYERTYMYIYIYIHTYIVYSILTWPYSISISMLKCTQFALQDVLPVEVRCYISCFRCLVGDARCSTIQNSSKGGALETGCSDLHYIISCFTISYYPHPLHPPPTAPP